MTPRHLAILAALLLGTAPASADPKPTATEVFHLRTECSKLGKQLLEEAGIGTSSHGFSVYFSKYDENTNRCYVMIKNTFLGKESGVSLTLYDGQGGGALAMWGTTGIAFIGDRFNVPPAEAYEYIQRVMKDAAPAPK